MKTQTQDIFIQDVRIQLIRKRVKHLRLMVCPPDGLVKVNVPLLLAERHVTAFLHSKYEWIKQKQLYFKNDVATALTRSSYQYHSGERHFFMGKSYLLMVRERVGRAKVYIENECLILETPPDSSTAQREILIEAWYRKAMKSMVPILINKWEQTMGQQVLSWGVKKMKSRWGTCNPLAKRIWLNLHLAKTSEACLEYVVVHEMVHFFERHHNANFKAHMDRFLPDWRDRKIVLNKGCS
jgi:predicted metal-dependent hydrolase